MKFLNGTYYCKMDSKGRIMLPVELRKQLADLEMDSFVLKRAVFENNLEMHPLSEWEKLMAKLNKLNKFKKKNIDFLTRFLAGVRNVNIDGTGRLQVPKDLVEIAGLKKEVVIASAINILQIWDKDTYEQFLTESTENFSDLAEEVMGDLDDE
jgi:MraZ protein